MGSSNIRLQRFLQGAVFLCVCGIGNGSPAFSGPITSVIGISAQVEGRNGDNERLSDDDFGNDFGSVSATDTTPTGVKGTFASANSVSILRSDGGSFSMTAQFQGPNNTPPALLFSNADASAQFSIDEATTLYYSAVGSRFGGGGSSWGGIRIQGPGVDVRPSLGLSTRKGQVFFNRGGPVALGAGVGTSGGVDVRRVSGNINWSLGSRPGDPGASYGSETLGVGEDGTTPTGPAGVHIEENGGDVSRGSDGSTTIDDGVDVASDVTGAYLVPVFDDQGVAEPVFIGGNSSGAEAVPGLLAASLSSLAAETAFGYSYWAFGLNFASVLLSEEVGGLDRFGIRFGSGPSNLDNFGTLSVGTPFDFTTYDPSGFRAFEIFGFESLGFNPDQGAPFDLGLTFVEPGSVSIAEFARTSPLSTSPVPEPTSMALFGLTAIGMGVMRRRRQKIVAEED